MYQKPSEGLAKQFVPGALLEVGPAVSATGGAVANTGIALHRLGNLVRLVGKIGNDPFGQMILQLLRTAGEGLDSGMVISEDGHTSYSIVISPPGTDRIFFHHTGTNDTFSSLDVSTSRLAGARLFHFGYPPLMRNMYEQDGEQLLQLFQKVKQVGLTTSLDMAKPDPRSAAGQVDWPAMLSRVLPNTDIFLPSLEEILYMLDRNKYNELAARHGNDLLRAVDADVLADLSDRLLEYGAAVIAIKLGEYGLYLRTTGNQERLQQMGACAPQSANWLDRELLTSSFQVDVVGTTGAGDCTIAGFLTMMLQHRAPHEALRGAVAVGAFNVERPDATSGVPTWQQAEERIAHGWEHRPQLLQLPGWIWDDHLNVWKSPRDSSSMHE